MIKKSCMCPICGDEGDLQYVIYGVRAVFECTKCACFWEETETEWHTSDEVGIISNEE